MGPDLYLAPDVLARLAATARRVADGLPAPPVAPAARVPEVRPLRDAASVVREFADAAERAVRRAREADEAGASGLRCCDIGAHDHPGPRLAPPVRHGAG